MKILIDLPEEKYEQIKKFKYPTIVERAIQNGVVLPDDWYEIVAITGPESGIKISDKEVFYEKI